MKRKRNLLITFALLGALAPSVQALSYNANVTPGVYYGSGNGNGFWTVDTANGIELGLRGHLRYQGVYNSGGDGTYSFNDATGTASKWNYDFSINAGSNKTVSDFTFQLWIDSDPGAGQIWKMFDPTLIPDNATPGFPYGGGPSSQYAQNSENVAWPSVGIPGYVPDSTTPGSYDFSLRALDENTGELLANTFMRVQVNGGTAPVNGTIPDSGMTLSLLGLSVAGLGALRRKFRA